MKSPKSIVISLLLVVFFAWVGFEVYSAVKEDEKKETADKILQFSKRDIALIEIRYGSKEQMREISLKRNSLRWEMTKPMADFVDHDFFFSWRDEMLDEDGRSVEVIHNNVDWSKYGLDNPAATIIFNLKDSQVIHVAVSAVDTFDKKTYLKVTTGDISKLYVGGTRWRALLLKLPEEFQEKNLFSWSRKHWEKIQKLQWLRADQPFTIVKEKNNQWNIEPQTIYPVDSSKIFSFLDDLSKFKILGFVKAEEQEKVIKNKPLLRIEVLFSNSNTEDPDFKKQTLSFYKYNNLKEDQTSDYLVYNTLGNRWLKISSEALKVLSPNIVDFFDFDFKLDIPKANEVTVSGVGRFTRQDTVWKATESFKPDLEGKKFDGGKVNLLLTELNSLHAVRFENQIKPNPKLSLREFHVTGDGFDKRLIVFNQVSSSQLDKNLEDCYLVMEPGRDLPFWVLKSSIEKLLLIEFYK